ncbi:MAG: alpha/beta hydrolase, partial [Caulobacter sp.]
MFTAILMAAATLAAPLETAVEIPGGLAPLKATVLSVSGEPRAAVVILPGSGPTDRDGNTPMGVRGSTYRLLAEGLAAQGVASLRMDKRGMFASGPAAADPNAVTVSILAADAN